MEKLFKTLDEQLEILKNKGLIIEDEKQAEEILLRENYFFINGYRIFLLFLLSKALTYLEQKPYIPYC